MSAPKYCDDPDHCTYSDCPTAFCDRNTSTHSLHRLVRGERQQHKNMDKEKLKKITDEQLEKVAVLVYQYDFPKDRDLPHQELKYKALHRYHNYPLTQKVVRDLVSLNLQTLIQIETAMMPEASNDQAKRPEAAK